ncbi:hypothetical protein AYO45_04275 [Gammaproteobacteria bacterium SCGC AG-212-F23]|nr:hypothetical protein AYO45_04275 [Gammaproteobacteria bacterium SCGC AG-212-F23]
MKKHIVSLGLAIFLSQSVLAEDALRGAEVPLSPDLKLVPIVQKEDNQSLQYSVTANYPQIVGTHLSPAATQFNQLASAMAKQKIQAFIADVKQNQSYVQHLPEAVRHNNLKIDYDLDVLKPQNSILLSIRMRYDTMLAGQAHPTHVHQVLNYDLTQAKTLALADLFKPKANYLKILSDYCAQSLNAKFKKDNMFIATGTAPQAKNFSVWNLQADGLLITFDADTVAPYVYGKQEINVPYAAVKNLLASNAVVLPCVSSAKNCEVE